MAGSESTPPRINLLRAAGALALAAVLLPGAPMPVPAKPRVLAAPRTDRIPASRTPRLWGPLGAGSHAVGFEALGLRDSSRSLDGEPRPIQIALWYPAVGTPGAGSLIFRDYFLLTVTERTLGAPGDSLVRAAVGSYRELLASNGVPGEATEAWFSSAMAGSPNADRAEGRFPLVLVAPGTFHAAFHHAILAEYLASHGYVVAIAPAPSRLAGPPRDPEGVVALARDQAADLEFVRAALADDPQVDAERATIVAHSFGARSAFLALIDAPWRALVSLDGGIANAHGREWLDAVDYDPAAIRTPVLHLFEVVDPEVVEPDFTLLDALSAADPIEVRVDGLHHVHFTSLGLVSGLVPGLEVGAPSPDVVERAAAVHRATLRFLDWRTGKAGREAFDAVLAGSGALHRRDDSPGR